MEYLYYYLIGIGTMCLFFLFCFLFLKDTNRFFKYLFCDQRGDLEKGGDIAFKLIIFTVLHPIVIAIIAIVYTVYPFILVFSKFGPTMVFLRSKIQGLRKKTPLKEKYTNVLHKMVSDKAT